MKLKGALVSLAALGTALSSQAAAQTSPPAQAAEPAAQAESPEGIPEIIVTAQKRAEDIQDVPIAVSAFTSEALQERAVVSVAQLSNIAPNVTLDAGTPFSGTSAVLSAYIRGIGANDFAFNIDPGVGVYLDGVYLARSVGANQDLRRCRADRSAQGAAGHAVRPQHDRRRDLDRHPRSGQGIPLRRRRDDRQLPADQCARHRRHPDHGRRCGPRSASRSRTGEGYMRRLAFPGASGFVEDPITSFKAAGYENAGLGREGGDNSWSGRAKLKWDNGGAFRITLSGDYSNVDQEQIANKLIATNGSVFAGTYNCAIQGVIAPAAPDPNSGICGGGPPAFAFIPGPRRVDRNRRSALDLRGAMSMPIRTTTGCPMTTAS